MSNPTLNTSYVFGINNNVRNNAMFIDDTTAIYPVGYQIAQYNIEKKQQKIFPIPLDGETISCMALHPTEPLIAIGTKTNKLMDNMNTEGIEIDTVGSVMLYDAHNLKRRKVYRTIENVVVKDFISIGFTNDGKHLIAQGCGPEWNLYIWTIAIGDKSKYICSNRTSNGYFIRKMSINPFDTTTTQICVTGTNIFRIFRFQDGFVKLIHQTKLDEDIFCHTWVSETRVICGTMQSKLLIFDSGDLICDIQYLVPLMPKMNNEQPRQPSMTAIASFSAGVLVGLDSGVVLYFEKINESPYYKKRKEVMIDDGEITSMNWPPQKDDKLIVSLKSSQLFYLTVESEAKGVSIRCDRLSQSFHNGPILGMDVSVSKPLVVTSGLDKSIRVWNYIDNTVEIVNVFNEAAQCVAIHPNGLYLLAGFNSSLKLMAILLDDIRPFWEHSVRGTRECRFSHGGHYFASISNLNVLVCDTWSFEIVATLKIASTRIRSIGWSEDDTKILTYCTDGSIQHWNIFTMKKEMEITIPGQLVTATFNNSATSTYVYVKDVGVKEIVKGFITREFVPKAPLSHIHITTGGQMMFMVTNFGSVKSVKYPFEPNTDVNDKECIEYIHHAAPITQIRTTFNERFLFTAGEDGCIWIYRIQDKEGTLVKREKDWSYSDEILVTKSDLRENYRLMNELKQRVDDIKLDSDTQLKLKDSIHTSKINDLVQKFSEEIYLLKKLIEKLHNERNSMNQKNSEELVAIKEANIEKIQEMKESFYQKLESEELRFSVLFARKSTLETQWARQINNIKENHKTRTDEITSYYKRKIEEKSVQIQRLIKELGQISVRFKGSIEEIEQDIENEVLEITYHFETKLKEESSMLKKIQEENRIMKQTYDALIQQVEEHKKEYANTVTDGKKLMLNIRSLENDILGLTNEVKERDDTIVDKEKRIYDLRKKNQELEKFKFVLDYKILELRKQVEPRERDIEVLRNQLKDMELEESEYRGKQLALNSDYQDLLLKNYSTQLYRSTEEWKHNQLEELKSSIQNDLTTLRSLLNDKNLTKKEFVKIYHKYRNMEEKPSEVAPKDALPLVSFSEVILDLNSKKGSKDTKAQESLTSKDDTRYRGQLEKTVHLLEEESNKAFQKREITARKMIEEGVILTREINLLRKDLQDRRFRVKKLQQATKEGLDLKTFIKEELNSIGLKQLTDIKTFGEIMQKTIVPLPPILPPLPSAEL